MAKRVGLPMRLETGLKQALLAQAGEQGLNMNDTAVAILAEHYGLAVEPTRLPSRAVTESENVCWMMPERLRDRITDDLTRQNRRRRRTGEPRLTQADLVNGVLRDAVAAVAA